MVVCAGADCRYVKLIDGVLSFGRSGDAAGDFVSIAGAGLIE